MPWAISGRGFVVNPSLGTYLGKRSWCLAKATWLSWTGISDREFEQFDRD